MDGETVEESDLLVDPNYTGPDEYLTIGPGETGTWRLVTLQQFPGTRNLRVVLEGSYRYGSATREGSSNWEGEVEFVNPEVKGLEVWVAQFSWGIKPSIIISDGKAYTGDGKLRVFSDGVKVFEETYEV
ncbi:MAG: hypothetical protein MAG715_00419 [Methanonatronarchaeales archaeon]|nr:hypothetical protein [Methanonatronarchaeales archaeon]